MTLRFMLFPIHHSAGGKYCPNSIYEEVILKCYSANCYINTYKSSSWPKMVNCPFTTKSSNSTTNWSLVWDSVLANRFQQLTPEDCQLWKLISGYKWLCKTSVMTRWEGSCLMWSRGSWRSPAQNLELAVCGARRLMVLSYLRELICTRAFVIW